VIAYWSQARSLLPADSGIRDQYFIGMADPYCQVRATAVRDVVDAEEWSLPLHWYDPEIDLSLCAISGLSWRDVGAITWLRRRSRRGWAIFIVVALTPKPAGESHDTGARWVDGRRIQAAHQDLQIHPQSPMERNLSARSGA
jgi:hypothetical protein